MSVITIYALFFDEIRVALIPKDADSTFYVLTLIAFAIFLAELIATAVAVPSYFSSFFFWLDLFSSVTLLLECWWIWYAATTSPADLSHVNYVLDLAKITRTMRAMRLVRFVRLTRLHRLAKEFKELKLSQRQRLQAIIEQRSESKLLRKRNLTLTRRKLREEKDAPLLEDNSTYDRQDSMDEFDRQLDEIDNQKAQLQATLTTLDLKSQLTI